jgi:hypothetical protein
LRLLDFSEIRWHVRGIEDEKVNPILEPMQKWFGKGPDDWVKNRLVHNICIRESDLLIPLIPTSFSRPVRRVHLAACALISVARYTGGTPCYSAISDEINWPDGRVVALPSSFETKANTQPDPEL